MKQNHFSTDKVDGNDKKYQGCDEEFSELSEMFLFARFSHFG